MPDAKSQPRTAETESKSEAKSDQATKRARRERRFLTEEIDNPLICRGID